MRIIIDGDAEDQTGTFSGSDYAVCYVDPQRGAFSNAVWKAWFSSQESTLFESGDHSAITFLVPFVQFPYTTRYTVIAADGLVHAYANSVEAVQGFQTLLQKMDNGSQLAADFPQFSYYHEVICPGGVYRLEFFGQHMDEQAYLLKSKA